MGSVEAEWDWGTSFLRSEWKKKMNMTHVGGIKVIVSFTSHFGLHTQNSAWLLTTTCRHGVEKSDYDDKGNEGKW